MTPADALKEAQERLEKIALLDEGGLDSQGALIVMAQNYAILMCQRELLKFERELRKEEAP